MTFGPVQQNNNKNRFNSQFFGILFLNLSIFQLQRKSHLKLNIYR